MTTTFGSASAIVGVKVTGHYVYRIDGYSRSKDLPKGKWIESPTFTAGDYSWRICYFPNGACASYFGYISIFMVLGASVHRPVKATHRLTLLDRAGNPVPRYSQCIDVREYDYDGLGHGCRNFIKREHLEAPSLGILVHDGFQIRCDVTVFDYCTEDRAAPLSDLQRHLSDLLLAGQGADATFLVGGETFGAHRCILAARSPVFEAQLFGATDAETGRCIRIDGIEPEVFKAMLNFVYTDSLPPEIITKQDDARWRANYKALLAAADTYGLQGLKLTCEGKLIEDIDVSTATELLALAVRHSCRALKEACTEFLEFPPVLEMAVAISDDFENVARSCPALLKEVWDCWFDEDDPIQDELRNLTGL